MKEIEITITTDSNKVYSLVCEPGLEWSFMDDGVELETMESCRVGEFLATHRIIPSGDADAWADVCEFLGRGET